MREDVSGELSLGEFAQSVNLSVWRLCHLFKSDIGMPPMRYLRVLRMERAKILLESSFFSVKEIGYRVGLTDESHFVRDFKATYGLSPACYRTQFRANTVDSHNGNLHSVNGNSHNGNGHSANGNSHNGNGQSANGNSHNGNGHSHDATQPGQLGQQLVRTAKQSLLPTIHLFICVMSTI